MTSYNIRTLEGTRYKVTMRVTGVEDFSDYTVYGFIQGIGRCDRTATPITISEA